MSTPPTGHTGRPPHSLRICLVGDSIATGTGDSRGLGWHGRLVAQALAGGVDVTVYDLGVRGDTSVDVARRWRDETNVRLPHHFASGIVFQFGLNDCAQRTWSDGRSERRVPMEISLATTREVLGQAIALRTTLMIGPAPIDDSRPGPQLVPGMEQVISNRDIESLDRRLEAVADEAGVPYLAVFDALVADERWSRATAAGDGIHPTAVGYDAMSELVARWPAWQTLTSLE